MVLQHAASEGLGTIENALTAAGVAIEYVRAFEGQPVPRRVDQSSGLVVMGGPMGVDETARFPFLAQELELITSFLKAQRPILGVCLGSQLLATALGAPVRRGRRKEIGWYPITLSPESRVDPLWRDQPSQFVGYHWHGDVFDLPSKAILLASSDISGVQAFRYGDRAYGLLFHMEVSQPHVRGMLTEFAGEIKEENLNPVEILNQCESFLPPLQAIGASVFGRWTDLV